MIIKTTNHMTSSEIEKRKPVWLAISKFYFDTQLIEEDISRIKEIFKKSGYSLSELKNIDYYEVKPIVGINLWGVAGEWAGFDEEWLLEEIQKRTMNRKRRNNFFTKWRRKRFDSNRHSYWNRFEDDLKDI